MKKIGIFSDTHSYIDDKIIHYLEDRDEIWHAGDIGNEKVLEPFINNINMRVVWGNIDNQSCRLTWPEVACFECEKLKVLMIHIAGKFGSYTLQVRELIQKFHPDLLICGHSHILKIAKDNKFNLTYINPGAAGLHGFHTVRTLLKFTVEIDQLKDFQIIEMPRYLKI
ncbi:MAG: metallophosphoesterase family protein [Saprospiraceae bacterium]|nr:metallophosphoesterase family protein [Saprospiraceae bacterium]